MKIYFALAVALALGCASLTVETDGAREASTFGQASVTETAPDGTVTEVESRGLSDNFAVGIVGSVVKAAGRFFGGGGEPPVVNVIVPGSSSEDDAQ